MRQLMVVVVVSRGKIGMARDAPAMAAAAAGAAAVAIFVINIHIGWVGIIE